MEPNPLKFNINKDELTKNKEIEDINKKDNTNIEYEIENNENK